MHSLRQIHLVRFVCLAACFLSLAACGGKVRYPSYYVLNVPAAPQAIVPRPVLGSAAVREFSAPRFLWTGPIVYRQSPEQMGFYNYDRWAVDPRSAVTSALLQTLQARGVFESVHMFDGHVTSDYLVTGTLDHLEEVDKGNDVFISVAVSAQLLDLKTGNVLWRDASSETSGLDHHAVSSLVAGMSQATENTVTRLVSSMQDRLAHVSASRDVNEARRQ